MERFFVGAITALKKGKNEELVELADRVLNELNTETQEEG